MAAVTVAGEYDCRPRKRQRLGWDQAWPQILPLNFAQDQPAPLVSVRLGASNPVLDLQVQAQIQVPVWGTALGFQGPLQQPQIPTQGWLPPFNREAPWRRDDKDGHYVFHLGENITPRYKIISKMGEGTFGRVLECWDRETQEYVAIKLIRNVQKYRDAAMIEIDVLRVLGEHDQLGLRRCVRLKNTFDYRNHVCMVFEKLGPSLYDFLKKNNFRPFSIDLVREFGRQLLESVAYMHELSLIHTDLKPENVLLVSGDRINVQDSTMQVRRVPKSCEIKLIDFGSTTWSTIHHSSVVSTRHYRAPEVILGLGWSHSCDLWSVGCILIELCTGKTLFQTHENLEHLAMMERVLGPIPRHMMESSCKYARHGKLNWPEGAETRESLRAVRKLTRLRSLVYEHVSHSAGPFVELLQVLLSYDPADRLSAKDALKHRFFTQLL